MLLNKFFCLNNAAVNYRRVESLYKSVRTVPSVINIKSFRSGSQSEETELSSVNTIKKGSKTTTYEVKSLPGSKVGLGKAPFYNEANDSLYYVDPYAGQLLRYDIQNNTVKKSQITGAEGVSFVVPVDGQENQYIVGNKRNLDLIIWDGNSDKSCISKTLATVQCGDEFANNRFNAAKVDAQGHLFAVTIEDAENQSGAKECEEKKCMSGGSQASKCQANGASKCQVNGSPASKCQANGSPSNGSKANGSPSNGSNSNGSKANGSNSNGSKANGSHSNGSHSNGSHSNGSHCNGSQAKLGELFMFDGKEAKSALANLGSISGFAFNKDGTKLFMVDSAECTIKEYEVCGDKIGSGDPRIIFCWDNCMVVPESLAVDAENNLYVCTRSGTIYKIDPCSGKVDLEIKLPVSTITDIVFGGCSLDTLYVTTGSGPCDEAPNGSLFTITGLGAKGLPMNAVKLPKDC